MLFIASIRYSKVRNGLRVRNITLADDGNYTCEAEVDAEGRFGSRTINVAVHSTSVHCHSRRFFLFPTKACLSAGG